MTRSRRRPVALLFAAALLASACGSDDGGGDDAPPGDNGEAAASGDDCSVRLGYSAWPGWFPWAVAEDQGLFEANGVDVDLTFFADYLGSLDAMVAGQLDANSQTLNDTMLGVASGSEQVIVVVNDNSTGNDAIIVDESINTIEDLEGKTVAAEAGVVDHFLLLQGLETVGLTEDDIDFRGVLTDAAAAAFAEGEFDAVGVFAPFTLQALERPGSKVLFSSADFPGTIPDHLVVTPELIDECPDTVQGLVNTWYATMDFIDEDPETAIAVMAEMAELSVEEYGELADGTTLFTAEEALEAFQPGDDTTSLLYTADLINPFLVDSGLIPEEADVSNMFDSSFTEAYLDAQQ
ncbi:MAG: ABC transporter substrate-binding protein [Acidimicrobiia bacterium]|nr:ABC transporter substrate-binding protein [Acidimicrobiia bacterium]